MMTHTVKKWVLLIAVAMMVTPLVACSKSEKPRNGGYFLMWYYPQKAIYKSTDGRSWKKLVDSGDAWPMWMTAGADGTLYASKLGTSPTILTSTDGKTWTPVAANPNNPQGEHRTYAICAGQGKTLYALSAHGDFQVSKDGGVTWTEKTRPVVEGARGAGDGFKGYCAVSPMGTQVLIQGWYFSPAAPILAVTTDEGQTWKTVKAPTERNESRGVGFLDSNIIFYADGETVYTSADSGATWKKTAPEKLLAKDSKNSFYSYRRFVSDGGKFVVGVEAAADGKDATNKWPGATFVSKDGGATFETAPLPWNTDPTPSTSDEYVFLTFVAADKK